MKPIRVVAVLAAGVGFSIARGADRTPGTVQDPPGRVFVDQPAGVTFADRDTPRDTTDPMHGSPYADLRAPGKTPSAPSPPQRKQEQQPQAHGAPAQPAAPAQSKPRAERRTANDGSTGSSVGTPTGPATGTAADTTLGTDQGYGTGTEQPPRR